MSVNPPETTPELDGRYREFLDFERDWWKHAGSKERAVRERFGMTAARYHQLLYRAVDEPAALAYDPMLVRRLRRLRESRRRQRVARRLGIEL
ncbi:MAG TPA: DUF3263 domain-containing protein [Actinomycetota bacterium]